MGTVVQPLAEVRTLFAVSPSLQVAAGTEQLETGISQPDVFTANGTTWTPSPAPAAPRAIWASSASDLFLVTMSGTF
jgi:hypothetical protein